MTRLWRIRLDRVIAASSFAGDFHHATGSVTLEWEDAGDLLSEDNRPERLVLCRHHRFDYESHGDGESSHVELRVPHSSGGWLSADEYLTPPCFVEPKDCVQEERSAYVFGHVG